MDTSALAATMVGMQSAATAQQMSLLAVQQANAMAQVAVNLLADAAEAGKALVAPGIGGAAIHPSLPDVRGVFTSSPPISSCASRVSRP